MVRKIVSIALILSSLLILIYDKNRIDLNDEKIDNIIEKRAESSFDGFIYFNSLNRRLLIKKGKFNEVLDNNLVLMVSDKKVFDKEYGNIILAGHNNKYVFSHLYKLKIGDEITISNFKNTYSYTVYKIDYVNIKDTSILDNVYDKKILTLITCTNNNQVRYVITSKLNHIISHN